jgi:hypothetical protein
VSLLRRGDAAPAGYGGIPGLSGRTGTRLVIRAGRRVTGVVLPVFVMLAIAVLAACASPGTTPPGNVPASPVEGVVTAVDSRGLAQVRGFSIRTDEGRTLEFRIDGLENPAEFPPAHLAEHRTTLEPVRVYFRLSGGDLIAYRLEDAHPAP